MTTLFFKCTLLSDVIINQKSATEGNQETLDFIPGSNFLGVSASSLYKRIPANDSLTIFHSGKVRFGDAHPLIENHRGLRIPASWYRKKNHQKDDPIIVHHGIPEAGLLQEGKSIQLKQLRSGFIYKTRENEVAIADIQRNFAIKSAYDSLKRRAEDTKMYGYQSIQKGSVWGFELSLDTDAEKFEDDIVNSLVGMKKIGRSSSAQYGLIRIEHQRESFITSFKSNVTDFIEMNAVFVYAESRLIFFDAFGQPSFTPSSEQLGFPGGRIDWKKSQIRTFQYAPYNFRRKTYDADRCGIEKGSVICVTNIKQEDINKAVTHKYVGSYLQEGFGKVILNPDFLSHDQTGGCSFTLMKQKTNIPNGDTTNLPALVADDVVLSYLKKQSVYLIDQIDLYKRVNAFVKKHSNDFKGNTFASQWGTIRAIATKTRDYNELHSALFSHNDVNPGYLVHGVAMEKWEERKRIHLLKTFIEEFTNKPQSVAEAVVNLAAEMAKKCRRD